MFQGNDGAEIAHQRREDCAEASAEIVREALTGGTNSGREEFGKERTHRAETAGRKKAQRKAEKEHDGIGNRKCRVEKYDYERADGKEDERSAAAQGVCEPGAGQVTEKGAANDDCDIGARAHDRKVAN